MKKILHTALTGFLVIAVACNDSGSKTDETTTTDTSAVTNESSMTPAADATMKATLQMKSDQEVPVNNSQATGSADVTYNKDTKTLTYTLNWSGLTGKATMAHIHGTAPKGSNAGVKHDLTNVLQKETSGSFTDSVKVDGNDIKEDSLLSGFYYFNIHTPANPGGEIRAQIEFNK